MHKCLQEHNHFTFESYKALRALVNLVNCYSPKGYNDTATTITTTTTNTNTTTTTTTTTNNNTNCSWRTWIDLHSEHSIAKMGKNIEKSPGNLRRLAVPWNRRKNHQLKLVWKTRKE